MIKVVICEDDLLMLKFMETIIHNELTKYVADLQMIAINRSEDESVFTARADIYFLDIDMPGKDGITLAKEIHNRYPAAIIIFVSNYDEFVYDCFEANPFRFMRKNIFEASISKVIKDTLKKVEELHQYLFIESKKCIHRLLQREICYIEKIDAKLHIKMADHQEFECRFSIKEMQKQMNEKYFVQIYPSVLVNVMQIEQFSKNTIVLRNGEKLPVSRRLRENARLKYMKFLGEEHGWYYQY